jgi:hypothetical protein
MPSRLSLRTRWRASSRTKFGKGAGAEERQRVPNHLPDVHERHRRGRAAGALFRRLPPDFFHFIIIDECHRGGANDESNWRDILDYFPRRFRSFFRSDTPKSTIRAGFGRTPAAAILGRAKRRSKVRAGGFSRRLGCAPNSHALSGARTP